MEGKKLRLTFSSRVKEQDLLGHVMGPDAWGARYYVQAVFELEDRTECNLYPLPPDESRVVRDEWGQYKVAF